MDLAIVVYLEPAIAPAEAEPIESEVATFRAAAAATAMPSAAVPGDIPDRALAAAAVAARRVWDLAGAVLEVAVADADGKWLKEAESHGARK